MSTHLLFISKLLFLIAVTCRGVSGCGLASPQSCARMIESFADMHNLESVTLNLDDGDAQLMVHIRKHFHSKYVSFRSAKLAQNRTSRNLRTQDEGGDRANNANSNLFPNLHVRFSLLGKGDQAALRKHIARERSDFWLLHLNPGESESSVKAVIDQLELDLTSNVYLFESQGEDAFNIDEIYKVAETRPARRERYTSWTSGMDKVLWMERNLTVWERRMDLSGLVLKISVMPSAPYLALENHPNGTLGMSGLFADVFHVLQGILHFEYELSTPPDKTWGNLNDDGSYTGMIGMLQRREIDLAPTSFTITNMRSLVVDFAKPIVEMHHRFFIKNPKDGLNWTAYLDPLAWEVWLVLVLFVLLVPPMLTYSVQLNRDEQKREFVFYRTFLFVASAISMARPWSVVPSSGLPKFIFLNILISGTFVYYHWEAMLISFLAVKTRTLPFETLSGLLSGTDLK